MSINSINLGKILKASLGMFAVLTVSGGLVSCGFEAGGERGEETEEQNNGNNQNREDDDDDDDDD